MTAFIYSLSTLFIVMVLVAVMCVALEIGYRLARRSQHSLSDAARGHVSATQASMLGIVALVLGFTFSRSLERFGARSDAVVAEANAIGTANLRAKLMPKSVGEPSRQLLHEYVDLRVESGVARRADVTPELMRRIEEVQAQLWQQAVQQADQEPNPISSLYLQSLNEMFDAFSSRKAAITRHVPATVVLLLLSIFVATAGVVGFSAGAANHRPPAATYFLFLIIAALMFLIIDLDRPRRGFVEVPHTSLLELQASLRNE